MNTACQLRPAGLLSCWGILLGRTEWNKTRALNGHIDSERSGAFAEIEDVGLHKRSERRCEMAVCTRPCGGSASDRVSQSLL